MKNELKKYYSYFNEKKKSSNQTRPEILLYN